MKLFQKCLPKWEMCGEFTFSWNFGNWIRIMEARYKVISSKKLFSRGESLQHTSNVFFSETILWTSQFFLVIIHVQSANCRSYCVSRITCDVRELKQQRRRRMRTTLDCKEMHKKSVMHVQSCCFADLNLLFFDALVPVAVDVPKLLVVSRETSGSYNLWTRINRSFVFNSNMLYIYV